MNLLSISIPSQLATSPLQAIGHKLRTSRPRGKWLQIFGLLITQGLTVVVANPSNDNVLTKTFGDIDFGKLLARLHLRRDEAKSRVMTLVTTKFNRGLEIAVHLLKTVARGNGAAEPLIRGVFRNT